MTDESNDGGDGKGPGNPGWELARLVGRYETFTTSVERRLEKIEEHLEKDTETFSNIKTTIATKSEQIDDLEKRVDTIENGGLSKRRRLQIDGTTIAAIILAFKELVTAFIGVFHG